jgi:hypothetical protein
MKSVDRSKHELKRLIEPMVQSVWNLQTRGLSYLIDEMELVGRPLERIELWGTLHFLPLGSPFCCMEPSCHLVSVDEHMLPLQEALQRAMNLKQDPLVTFRGTQLMVVPGVEFDELGQRTPVAPNVNERDGLGRTALWRAVARGYTEQVEELLAAGADVSIPDINGKTVLDVARADVWIRALIEGSLGKGRGDPGYGKAGERVIG